jgi:hypothetical protein
MLWSWAQLVSVFCRITYLQTNRFGQDSPVASSRAISLHILTSRPVSLHSHSPAGLATESNEC